jgi:hypothetical protein
MVLGPGTETNATFIGVVVAVCGNVLISFALNCQKLAHRKIGAAYNTEHGLDDDDILESNGVPVPGYQAITAPPVDVLNPPAHSQSMPVPTPSRSPVVAPRQAIPLLASSSPVGSYDSRPSIGPRSRTQSSLRTHSPIAETGENSSSSTSRAEPATLDDLEADLGTSSQHGPKESAYLHSKLW